jgi:RNA polymerase sigma factor (sigma-70 family)
VSRGGVTPIGASRRPATDSGASARPGSSETLGQAYVRRHPELLAFMLRRTGDAQVAEDLVQDLWLCIADDADVTGLDNPDAWLQRIAVNLTLNWLKRNRFRSRLTTAMPEHLEPADDAPDQERAVLSRQGVEFLKDVIEELPQRQRTAFLLYRGEGLSLKETAKHMGVQVITVQVQVSHALRYLRGRLMEAGLWP